MDSREFEMLRQRLLFLEQTLERCMEHIAALEARVATLEMRPVAVAPTEEMLTAVAQRAAELIDPAARRRKELLAGTQTVIGGWEPSEIKRSRKK
jgi:hypothetical protein